MAATEYKKIKRHYGAVEASTFGIARQWFHAEDTGRIVVTRSDAGTRDYFWNSVSLAKQTSANYGSTLIGTGPISGVTPAGGSVGDSGTVFAMLQGVYNSAVVLQPSLASRNTIQAAADVVTLTIKGRAAQTANLQEWQDSASVVNAFISPAGAMLAQSFTGFTLSLASTATLADIAASGKFVSTQSGSDASAAIQLLAAQPTLRLKATGQTTNSKEWDFTVSGITLLGRTRTDALGTGATWLTVTRTGAAISSISLDASTINTSAGDFAGTSGVLDIHTNVGTGLVRLGGGAAAANTLGGFIGLYGNTAGGGAGGFLALSSGQVAGAQVNLQVRDNEQHAFQALDHASAYEIMSFDTRTGARKIMLNDAVAAALTLSVTGNLAVNTNKFTVAASSGDTLIAGALTLSGLSAGRIPVVSTAGLIIQDNLYWDAANDRLGIGASPTFDLDLVKAVVGNDVTLRVTNTDNTSGGSLARIRISSGGASGGDAQVTYSNGATEWAVGYDNSAAMYVISKNSSLGTNNALTIDTNLLVTCKASLKVEGNYLEVPSVAGNPTNGTARIGFNNISGHFVGYNGTTWQEFA